jgi:NAD(P)-dependent dehydrogenase (short-subunit alcohol dehydrogenase family)
MTKNISSQFDVTGFGVIVTGGASGLGLAYGEVLAAHGARVTLIDLNPNAVAAQTSRLREEGLDVRGAVADVTDHAALDAVSHMRPRRCGRIILTTSIAATVVEPRSPRKTHIKI